MQDATRDFKYSPLKSVFGKPNRSFGFQQELVHHRARTGLGSPQECHVRIIMFSRLAPDRP
jgi:hypothetical protein